jgi:hypothetical protein
MLGIITIAVIVFFLTLVSAVLTARLTRYPNRGVMNVAEFLRAGNPKRMLELLDPRFEAATTKSLPRRRFLRVQRADLHSVLEFLSCMFHSTRICLELASNELQRETIRRPEPDSEDYIESALTLHHAAVEFRTYCFLAIIRVRLWLIFRTQWWLPLPSVRIATLREIQGLNFSATYNKFLQAVADVGRLHGPEFQESFLQALIKSDPIRDALRESQKQENN